MLYLIDDATLMMFILLPVGFVTFLWLMMELLSPKARRDILKAWLLKKTIVATRTATDALRFDLRKALPGGQLEMKVGPRKSIKIVPASGNPIVSRPLHLERTGIPIFFADDSKALAVGFDALKAIKVVKSDKAKLPEEVKAWAKETQIPVTRLKEIADEVKGGVRQVAEEVMVPLLDVTISELKDFFHGTWDEMQFQSALEQERQDAEAGRGGGSKMWFLLPIGIGVIVVVLWLTGILRF